MITQLIRTHLNALRGVPIRILSEKTRVDKTTCWRAVNEVGSVKLSTIEAFERANLIGHESLAVQRLEAARLQEHREQKAKRLARLIDGYPNDEKLLRQEYEALTGKRYRRKQA